MACRLPWPPTEWEPGRILSEDETRPWRLIYLVRPVTDHDAYVELRALQYADGSVADFELFVYDRSDNGINSDQARELAAALLEAAAELDGWAGHDEPEASLPDQHVHNIRKLLPMQPHPGGGRRDRGKRLDPRAADPGRLGARIHNPGDRGRGDWGRAMLDDILSLARRPAIARGV